MCGAHVQFNLPHNKTKREEQMTKKPACFWWNFSDSNWMQHIQMSQWDRVFLPTCSFASCTSILLACSWMMFSVCVIFCACSWRRRVISCETKLTDALWIVHADSILKRAKLISPTIPSSFFTSQIVLQCSTPLITRDTWQGGRSISDTGNFVTVFFDKNLTFILHRGYSEWYQLAMPDSVGHFNYSEKLSMVLDIGNLQEWVGELLE